MIVFPRFVIKLIQNRNQQIIHVKCNHACKSHLKLLLAQSLIAIMANIMMALCTLSE